MQKSIGLALTTLSFAFSTLAVAHGEEELGPHNGYIKMPGAYHVEVVPQKKSIDVFLLDINFENATTTNSLIKASITANTTVTTLHCVAKNNFFNCPVTKSLLQSQGTLTIESKRDNSEGMTVNYKLPLDLQK